MKTLKLSDEKTPREGKKRRKRRAYETRTYNNFSINKHAD